MTAVAVTGFAAEVLAESDGRSDAELLGPVVERALADSGIGPGEVDILGTASSEFLNGVVGGVMGAFDALPGWPPRIHSHLEADGAFALYECWARLLAGEGESALVCAFSRPRADDPRSVLGLQLDPYVVAPLRPAPEWLAALQARALLDSGRYQERDFVEVVAARRPGHDPDYLLDQPYAAAPLRPLDCSTVCTGAAALVISSGARVLRARRRPAWIRGIAQQMEPRSLGARTLTESPSVAAVSARLGLRGSDVDVVESHAPFSHQELIVNEALGVRRTGAVNPSGGALPADPIMATGLIRIGSAADSVMRGEADRAVGHATNGPCLQHNLLCLMESRR